MFVRDYEWYIRHLTEHVNMKPSDAVFVENVAAWCREHGVEEPDEHRPFRIVSGSGAGPQMLISEVVPDEVIEERLNAAHIRNQLRSVGTDRADLLNSATKKIAYLVLREYASNLPELAYDDLAMEEWVFGQMDRIGMFQP